MASCGLPTSSSSVADQSPSDDVPDATPLPSELPDGARQPADQALAAMTAYVDHSGDAAAWFARLSPYLSRQAAEQYQYTDPANVPATQIVGVPAVISATDYLVTVDQGTDAGTHRLLLSRAADGSWQVESITPPDTGPTT